MSKLTNNGVVVIHIIIWILAFAPSFIPALNTLEPHILGLPFVVFWEIFVWALQVAMLFITAKYVWDPFDNYKKPSEREGGDQA